MTLSHAHKWLYKAQAGSYAVGAFNANTLEQIQAIVHAGQMEQAPVIVQISYNALKHVGEGDLLCGLKYMAAIGRTAAETVSTPVILHLDHGTQEIVHAACQLGFTSLMFDGSELSLQENIASTAELCAMAHEQGIWFEAELGYVPKPGSARPDELTSDLTDPSDVASFIGATHVDALAVAIGSHHGQTRQETNLDLPRLEQIRRQSGCPLVLHGSSGVADPSLKAGIKAGLCKINIATQLNIAFTGAVRYSLENQPELVDPRPYLNAGRTAVIERVRERIRFLGCAGKAA